MRIVFLLLLAASALAAMTIAAVPARADAEFAYCATPGFATGQDCTFYTLAQCQAAVRGLGTDCEPNPRYLRQVRTLPVMPDRSRRP
jgi:hypothetical protein